MKKKILILGASELQLPIIKKAKEMGFYVGVADYNPNAIGKKYADSYFTVSTIDTEKILEVARKFQPQGIVTMATDMPMRSIATVCSKLGLAGIDQETAFKATDKIAMIKAFKEHKVASPNFEVLNSESDTIERIKDFKLPCIMKPADSSGSRGIVKVLKKEDAVEAFEYSRKYSKTGLVLMEEYMEGIEISVECFVINSKNNILAITEKLTTGAPHFVEMGHTQPAEVSEKLKNDIGKVSKKAIKAIGIKEGPVHIEMMLTKEGPKMIELGARMGGDCITSHLVPLSTGIDMVKATIQSACGYEPELTSRYNKAAAIRYLVAEKGIISEISGIEQAKKIPGIQEVILVKNQGDISKEIESSTDRIGMIISQGDCRNEAIKSCEKAIKEITITVR